MSPEARMRLSFNALFLLGVGLILATAATAGLTAAECRDLIGNLDPEGVDPTIVRACTHYLMERIQAA
ncbi:hypothetical protein BJY01DRAFT_202001 [Aspergillus pseudoustus]|uniref:Uncharacterized protein n=1 Tax=Aspergillus pseudoustus TaxID=1810923 RepID=A0ABR4L2M8_9EURO